MVWYKESKLKCIVGLLGLVPIQDSWRRPWSCPSGTDRCPCWQSGGGEGRPVAQDPSNKATSQRSEWHTWREKVQVLHSQILWLWLPSIRCTEMTHPVGRRAGLNSPHQELVKNSAICISSPSHAYVFPQTQVLDLVLRSADRWKTQVEEICCVMSAGALAVTLLACSPPSLWVFSSHWVWCSGCSVVCTSSECWPDRWLASVGTHQRRSKQSLVCERCVDSS